MLPLLTGWSHSWRTYHLYSWHDRHPYTFISLQRAIEAICSGTRTMVGDGTVPADSNKATTRGPWNLHRLLEAVQELPLNFGFIGKGNDPLAPALMEQIAAAWGDTTTRGLWLDHD
jgi:urease alpha subunit